MTPMKTRGGESKMLFSIYRRLCDSLSYFLWKMSAGNESTDVSRGNEETLPGFQFTVKRAKLHL